jgi:hypothetical protein
MANDRPATRVESDGFDDLAVVAHRLNSSSDDLNAALRRIEARINALALGIERFVPILSTRAWTEQSNELRIREWDEDQLGYGRIGDGWGLLTRTAHFCDDPTMSGDAEDTWDFGDEKPLLRASREIRIKAVAAIPELLKELKSQADAMLRIVETAERLAEGGSGDYSQPPDDALKVPCQVSERSLQFYSGSSDLPRGEFIAVDVCTGTGKERRKLCGMFVTREDLIRALSQVKMKDD